MTKVDIVDSLCEHVRLSKRDLAKILDTLFEIIKDTLENGDTVKISGFGNFVLKNKKERRGRNPQTGDELIISARRVMTFKPSQVLKNAVNSRRQ
ncbi:MAG: integration host factor subunit alpha [Thermodesulfobacteriota bacterium]|nr:integration host factor subunit alpha [Thermodesulfobacteriota bacterium]